MIQAAPPIPRGEGGSSRPAAPRSHADVGTASVVHPTARWTDGAELPATALNAPVIPRRLPRPAHQGAVIPWPHLIFCISLLSLLIVLVLCQKAQLISYQYRMVELSTQRQNQLRLRDELRLTIQRLGSLDRVDRLSRKQLGMVTPGRRMVLDLGLAQGTALISLPRAHRVAARRLAAANDYRVRRADGRSANL